MGRGQSPERCARMPACYAYPMPMFNPSREEVRRFFFATWRKYRAQVPLEGLEKTALEVVLLHPEYHALLQNEDTNIGRDFQPEGAQLNPFLHLSLHVALAEQLSI